MNSKIMRKTILVVGEDQYTTNNICFMLETHDYLAIKTNSLIKIPLYIDSLEISMIIYCDDSFKINEMNIEKLKTYPVPAIISISKKRSSRSNNIKIIKIQAEENDLSKKITGILKRKLNDAY